MTACIEKKMLLDGTTELFTCELLHLDERFGVLKYVIDRNYSVGELRLQPGDVTLGCYWSDRPYTLYIWHFPGIGRAYYFNLADRISLRPDQFAWRDLVVDILIDVGLRAHVLDEEELPRDLSPGLRSSILSVKADLLLRYRDIISEVEKRLEALHLAREHRA